MNIEIRTATTADLSQLVSLLQQLSLEPSREDPAATDRYEAAFDDVLSDPRQTVLVAVDGESVVGTVTLIVVPNLSHVGRPYAIVENVVVDAADRGRGIGEALMHGAIERARNAGCYKIALTSNRARVDAHRFYERLGFTASHIGFRMDF